jgi:hypothetical protein
LAAAVLAQVSNAVTVLYCYALSSSVEFNAQTSIFPITVFQAKLPMSEIAATVNEFRNRHLSELTEVCDCIAT